MRSGAGSTRDFWNRQLRQWHWISSALALALMLLFAVSGFTLNHADVFEAEGRSTSREYELASSVAALIDQQKSGTPVPQAVSDEIFRLTGADVSGQMIDNQYGEVGFDLARPGRDATVTLDLNERKIHFETIDRGAIALLNDLHKGRHAGLVWGLLIDISALIFVVFTLTGLGLLYLHSRMRASTWPLTSLGMILPAIAYLLFVH